MHELAMESRVRGKSSFHTSFSMLHSQACSEMEKGFVQIPREDTDEVRNLGLKSWASGIWDGLVPIGLRGSQGMDCQLLHPNLPGFEKGTTKYKSMTTRFPDKVISPPWRVYSRTTSN